MTAFIHHDGVDAVISMTANPNWPEVQVALLTGMTAADRPDIVCRVLGLKLEILKQQLVNGILGETVRVDYIIEFQNRGLPRVLVYFKGV